MHLKCNEKQLGQNFQGVICFGFDILFGQSSFTGKKRGRCMEINNLRKDL